MIAQVAKYQKCEWFSGGLIVTVYHMKNKLTQQQHLIGGIYGNAHWCYCDFGSMVGNILATISCQLNAVGIGCVVGNPCLMTKNHPSPI